MQDCTAEMLEGPSDREYSGGTQAGAEAHLGISVINTGLTPVNVSRQRPVRATRYAASLSSDDSDSDISSTSSDEGEGRGQVRVASEHNRTLVGIRPNKTFSGIGGDGSDMAWESDDEIPLMH